MTVRLRKLIKKETLAAPGAFNAVTAMLIEKCGFKAVYASGAGLSNSRGLPDTGLLSRRDVERELSNITKAVNCPVIIDADTGFGGPAEVRKTVSVFEAAGAEAIQIEDQEFPKRCGHLPGKRVIQAAQFAKKIKAAVSARAGRDFLIIARTDARSVNGIEDAVTRAGIYLDAGADIVFPEALEAREEFLYFSREIKAPLLANMTEFGKSPYLTVDDFRKMGYSIVIFPMTCFRVAMGSMKMALGEIKRLGTQKGLVHGMETREELYRLLGYSDYK